MSSTPNQLRSIKNLSGLVTYLRNELHWPIETDEIEDLTFDYQPEELGLEPEHAVKVRQVKQLRPLETGQPWGIFYVEFEKKRLPVVVLRRILSHLVVKKRASANKSDAQRWRPNDLLFISAFGDEASDKREIAFAHFRQADGDLPTLRVLGWDGADTVLKLENLSHVLEEKLRWPANPDDADAWREQWSGAFQHRLGHVVRTADHLAKVLADLARRIRDAAQRLLNAECDRGHLTRLFNAFQAALIHDLTEETFADAYAQTITYGLLTAAINRTEMSAGTAGTYVKADDLALMVRVTSPFLKEMLETFLTVGGRRNGVDFDELGIQDVVELLRGDETDLPAILRDFGNKNMNEDPVIHFYQHFLDAYNKKLRIQRGVFYTPQPVVSYIVRSVHELLQTEFGLEDGLASTVTWREMLQRRRDLKLPTVNEPGESEKTISPDEPFVQILDPATGTATFLVEVIDVIYRTLIAKWKKEGRLELEIPKLWNEYVPRHLLPRLHGYELLAAPYAVAHLKLGLKLTETGYRFGSDERARIYLTNALEPKVRQLPQIGFEPLAHEAKAVNEIKWYKRFTVVIGNPPYSLYGQLNRIPFILDLLQDYKRGLEEKKVNLDDDFIKFVRYGQYLLANTGVGILGLITNSTYLDGITHRVMRSSLLESFGRISVLDLHGSSKRLEKNPSGGVDENVFDIQTGVAISLLVRGSASSAILHGNLWGTREDKYQCLASTSIRSTNWSRLSPEAPYRFFLPKDTKAAEEYRAWPGIKSIFVVGGCGIKTERDPVSVCWSAPESIRVVEDFRNLSPSAIRQKYGLGEDSRDWTVTKAKADVLENTDKSLFRIVLYRPFDERHMWYSGQTRGFIGTPSYPTVRHLLSAGNLALLTCRQQAQTGFQHVFCVNRIVDHSALSTTSREITSAFPLYVVEDGFSFDIAEAEKKAPSPTTRRPNFLPEFLKLIGAKLHGIPDGLTPEDIFHYAYGVLHSPDYRSRYAEFLKIDFPRLPLTGNLELFCALSRLGGELVALHLLESPKFDQPITEYIGGRAPEVEKVSWSRNTVWLDKAQTTGFKGVREDVWNFHIGGYQVCEKWLKDRKGRTLSADDRGHYQKIVVALSETIRLMVEIDKVIEKHGGWPRAFSPPERENDDAYSASCSCDLSRFRPKDDQNSEFLAELDIVLAQIDLPKSAPDALLRKLRETADGILQPIADLRFGPGNVRVTCSQVRSGSIELKIIMSVCIAGAFQFFKDYDKIKANVILFGCDVKQNCGKLSHAVKHVLDLWSKK